MGKGQQGARVPRTNGRFVHLYREDSSGATTRRKPDNRPASGCRMERHSSNAKQNLTLCAIKDAGIDEDWQKISNLALWNPGELKIKVKGSELVTRTALSSILRKDLENKLSALAQRDLKV